MLAKALVSTISEGKKNSIKQGTNYKLVKNKNQHKTNHQLILLISNNTSKQIWKPICSKKPVPPTVLGTTLVFRTTAESVATGTHMHAIARTDLHKQFLIDPCQVTAALSLWRAGTQEANLL